ncbi:Gabpb1 [Symbiodinium sp. CCMP2592]|nr:Gabpb1 [Symbiodinium sp. CCMP2592]
MVKTCPTARLGGDLPIPYIGTMSGALPKPDALRPRLVAMELGMRWVPGWQPLDGPQAVLPTALEMPDDAAMTARQIDALIVGVLTVGLAVVAASVPVALVSLLASVGSSTGSIEEDDRLLSRAEAGGGKASQDEEEEFEMQLGPVKTAIFAVYYVCNIIFLLVLTSWSKAENLMLGGAGLAWEVIWMWLVVVLATDVLGYFFRAVQAAIMKRQINLMDPAMSMVMSVLPVLGPRVDLLKDCLFAGAVFQLAVCQPDDSWRRTAGFWVGNAALLTIFLPAPFLFRFETTRRDLAAEFWPALVARLRVSKAATGQQERQPQAVKEKSMWEKAMGFAVPKLVAQCTTSRLWTALGEDLPQAILAIAAMVVFEQYSGMLLVNLVVSGGKIAAVFILRVFIWELELYLVDPVTCAAFAVSHGRGEEALHDVIQRGWADFVAALLSAGVDKDAMHNKGPEPGRGCCRAVSSGDLPEKIARRREGRALLFLEGAVPRGLFRLYRPLRLSKSQAMRSSPLPGKGSPSPLNFETGPLNALAYTVAAVSRQDNDKGLLSPSSPLSSCSLEPTRPPELAAPVKLGSFLSRGETALHGAARGGSVACVRLLLDAGSNKDAKNDAGYTPLHWAARNGHADCVELLLKAGADKGLKDIRGMTALYWAERERVEDCAALLRS